VPVEGIARAMKKALMHHRAAFEGGLMDLWAYLIAADFRCTDWRIEAVRKEDEHGKRSVDPNCRQRMKWIAKSRKQQSRNLSAARSNPRQLTTDIGVKRDLRIQNPEIRDRKRKQSHYKPVMAGWYSSQLGETQTLARSLELDQWTSSMSF